MSKAKGGLGKGLSALIRPTEPEPLSYSQQPSSPIERTDSPEAVAHGTITHLEVSKIRPNPLQPRADFDPQALDELKESIRQKGIIQAITVRKVGDAYELISGERRLRACQELGVQTIPAYIIDVQSDQEMLELALVENLQREHLNPIEIAISYQRLMRDVGLTAEDIAQKVSKDRTTVTNFLRLLKLPTVIQDALRKSQITMGHARALINVPDEAFQRKLFDKIVAKDLNVRQVEKYVREYGQKTTRRLPNIPPKSHDSTTDSMAERMQQVLATRVRINPGENGKGEILIEYYSHDDLGRLFDLISSVES